MSNDGEVASATLIGGGAVLMWGGLALLTTWTGGVPPFQLVAMSFSIAFVLALAKWLLRREPPLTHLRHPAAVWVVGLGGLFGYHFLYFVALRNAPPAEASLIAYLWPLLIVLFSALLPGERLRWYHLAGVGTGLAGCVVLIGGGGGVRFSGLHTAGYLAALGAALVWSSYSVLSRRFGTLPTDTVGWFCAGSAVLGAVCHLLFEDTVWPADTGQWLAVLGLGLGPVGLAFFVWDIGVKRGNIKVLGAMSYAAPLISTLALVAFGKAEPTATLGIACVAIVGGALLAAKDMFRRAGPA